MKPTKILEMCKNAANILRKGEIIVYPTDTVYGMGGDATSKDAVKKVFELKKRPLNNPLSVLVSGFEMLEKYAEIDEEQMKILRERLPGPYTFVLKPKSRLPVSEGNIGFRVPDHWCTLIAKGFGKPITATSANLHGQSTPKDLEGMKNTFKESVSLYIDGGTLEGKPSIVIDLTEKPIKVIRQ